MQEIDFSRPATQELAGAASIGELAYLEGASPADYALRFADALCNGEPLSAQRAGFAALVDIGGRLDPDTVAAEEVGKHFLILDGLFKRLLIDVRPLLTSSNRGASEAAERLLNVAFKAQRASLSCLSALKVLRDSKTSTTPAAPGRPGPAQLSANRTKRTRMTGSRENASAARRRAITLRRPWEASSGPKSALGKWRASTNATTHGAETLAFGLARRYVKAVTVALSGKGAAPLKVPHNGGVS